MGWCSGTSIFDKVATEVLYSDLSNTQQYRLLRILVIAMYERDWDCESDSRYYDHPMVQRIFRELNPE